MMVRIFAAPRPLDERLQREEQRRWRGDMAEENGARSRRYFTPDSLDEIVFIHEICRDRHGAELGAALLRDEFPCAQQGAIFLIAAQDFVAKPPIQRADDEVERAGGVGGEDEVIGLRVDEGCESLARGSSANLASGAA